MQVLNSQQRCQNKKQCSKKQNIQRKQRNNSELFATAVKLMYDNSALELAFSI